VCSSDLNLPTTATALPGPQHLGGFCAASTSVLEKDAKCGALDANVCASTSCCVLLGGSKCVAGNENGPSNVANYGDPFVLNKDLYYYQGKCFGNCPGTPQVEEVKQNLQ
jgi:hypothetical protein